MSFSTRPAHWFALLGVPMFLIAVVTTVASFRVDPNYVPISILLFFLSFHFFALGLLGELVVLSGDHRMKDLALRAEDLDPRRA